MQMKNGIPEGYSSLISSWLEPQISLPGVIRWKKYLKKGKGARKQNSLQHSLSITIAGGLLIRKLSAYMKLDALLLMTALAIHDVGEGRTGDTHYIDKSEKGDQREYRAFLRIFQGHDPQSFRFFKRAYLLQYCLKDMKLFPSEAQRVMRELAKNKRMEALAFDAIERWDYMLYAMEQYHDRGNIKILIQTTRNQYHHFELLVSELPGLRQQIWTEEFAAWCRSIMDKHANAWIEHKGER
jgi:5'-deoxynucleotidase YfbR-like HD superfamily hydrolase